MPDMQELQKSEENNNILDMKNNISPNMTISTKMSTDHLICKSPLESPSNSVKSIPKRKGDDNCLLCLGLLQFIFGFLMVVFGGLVIHYDASLSQLGGGIWAGCLVMTTGIIGISASTKEWCPLRSTFQKITHTIFLALSLVSLAIAQLVVALAATGATRDINNSDYTVEEAQTTTTQAPSGTILITLPSNYLCILANLGLGVVSAGEFIVAAVASYKSSRALCPCFRRPIGKAEEIHSYAKDAFISSWLGKHSSTPQLYVVAPSTLSRTSQHSGGMSVTPVFALPPQMVPPRVIRYPLIPAPLGTIPSPIIPPSTPRKMMHGKKKHAYSKCPPKQNISKKQKTQPKEKVVSDADVVRTYTGLDKTIAEEFIDICDSRNISLCSDSSCNSSCQRSCTGCNNGSDVASREYLVNGKA